MDENTIDEFNELMNTIKEDLIAKLNEAQPNPTSTPNNVDTILANRGQQYGEFSKFSKVAQTIKSTCYSAMEGNQEPFILEAIDMIAHKLARISTGNALNIDSWDDIGGYSKLVSDKLQDFPNAVHTDVKYRQNNEN